MKRCSKGKNCGATCITRYKVRLLSLGKDFSSLLKKVKEKVDSESSGGALKPKFTNPGQVDEHYNKRIAGLRNSGKTAQADKLEKEKELTKERIPLVSRFLKDISQNLPPGAKVVNNGGILNISFTTKTGDLVEVSFSPRLGFHFRVNGDVNPGSVKTEAGKIQSARAAALIFRSVARSLPEGSVVKTRAREGDPKLISTYKKSGFSDPEPQKGLMFAIRGADGKLTPANQGQYERYESSPGSMFFREG
jgi:hypothetical protein